MHSSSDNKSKGKGKEKEKTSIQLPSANWLALQKKISKGTSSKKTSVSFSRKRKRLDDDGSNEAGGSGKIENVENSSFNRTHTSSVIINSSSEATTKQGEFESPEYFKGMVFGNIEYTEEQRQPGRYLALDCEMVGVGPEGSESSLARVSLVNYYGAIILDEFVRQRERVVDYRTAVSGVRDTDMIKAKSFIEVQKQVAEFLKDRILVGHAVNNDLKALLLSHPRQLTRDTQLCAGKARLLKTKYPALRKLAEKLLGITIQAGEHSSVTDARATMAIYRLNRKEWDKGFRPLPLPSSTTESSTSINKKRKAESDDNDEDAEVSEEEQSTKSKAKSKRKKPEEFPGGGRRGVSSGLSTIIRRGRQVEHKKSNTSTSETKKFSSGKTSGNWWTTLGGISSKSVAGSKGSLRL